MLSSLVLTLGMLMWLILMISLIFWLNKYNQEVGLIGGNLWKKVYKKSQAYVESIEDEGQKKSIRLRLRFVLITQKIILFSLVGVVAAIVLWQFV